MNAIIGRTFSKLTVISWADPGRRGAPRVNCLCECGKSSTVFTSSLYGGATQSCGCLGRQARVASNTRHGMTNVPGYKSWQAMVSRCTVPSNCSYPHYGGMGIQVCAEWIDSPGAFLAHIGDRPTSGHSIDRIDNDKGYFPGNVRWATAAEQSRNKRRSCLMVSHKGAVRRLAEVIAENEIPRATVMTRLYRGWPESRLFEAVRR